MINERAEKISRFSALIEANSKIDPSIYTKFDVKKGLRNSDGAGVLVGLTRIGEVHGYILDEGEKIPDYGRLMYRGIRVTDIVNGFQKEARFGFEEVCYLILLGELPKKDELDQFNKFLGSLRALPEDFTRGMILKAPSSNIMNALARSVLAFYSYDKNPEDTNIDNVLRQSVELIAKFPAMVAYSYQAMAHYHQDKSLYIHQPKSDLSTSENLLYMLRPDNKFTRTEAEILDLLLVLHCEHGGGNNSAFTVRVVSSTGTDTYSAIAAAIGSLKGPKHGGANLKVMQMMDNIKENINDWTDEEEIESYLKKMLNKEVFDHTGLIYGMGHAVYTLSDPRAVLLKQKAYELAEEKDRLKEFNLYLNVEKLATKVFMETRNTNKEICANIDFYSGFVYSMLSIPPELYTPLFAASRIVGWCAHRMEELISVQKIIRPAYKSVAKRRKYIPLSQR
ncbi:citrate/2-methylcitrate synthase [Bacillota bacterium LX-D]|nr:citrate/2-methylcitrate synthase [Bacillota bacterium LX-D]